MKTVRLKCAKCGGQKFIGEKYYLNGTYYIDVTCVVCSDTRDVKVEDLNRFLEKLSKHRGENDKK
jgi:hypothetical protein